MNPRTLTQMVLALMVANKMLTGEEAAELLTKAGQAFADQILDELSLEQMIDLLDNPPERSFIETPDTPKLII